MDAEDFKRDHRALVTQMAETQVERCIGEAALRLLVQGQPLNVQTLTQSLNQSVAHLKPDDVGRIPAATAIAALQDAAAQK